MGKVRDWYRSQPRWIRRVNVLAAVVALLSLAITLSKSGPEFRAIVWHRRHGDRITVNGVSFPVYKWYCPENRADQFSVSDAPGPLRPTDDRFTAFSIKGWRDARNQGTPQELTQKEIGSYEKAGYHGTRIFELKIRDQSLYCWEQTDDRFSIISFSCYGDGPIYHLYFVGNEEARDRFNQMLADAH